MRFAEGEYVAPSGQGVCRAIVGIVQGSSIVGASADCPGHEERHWQYASCPRLPRRGCTSTTRSRARRRFGPSSGATRPSPSLLTAPRWRAITSRSPSPGRCASTSWSCCVAAIAARPCVSPSPSTNAWRRLRLVAASPAPAMRAFSRRRASGFSTSFPSRLTCLPGRWKASFAKKLRHRGGATCLVAWVPGVRGSAVVCPFG